MQQVNLLMNDSEQQLSDILCQYVDKNSVFLCVGCDKVFSDSLGPKVGTLLNLYMKHPLFVYGVEGNCITAKNLLHCYNFVKSLHKNKRLVVIDAAVGTPEQVGCVQVFNGGLEPGAATNKNLPKIGDVAVVGVVGEKGMGDFYTTNLHKLKLVEKMATIISSSICNSSIFKDN
ncbi:MAG: spore protease YyaC [Clostridia bacterium]|nr:spore protease YyaC [Clostridia bacterium]